MSDLLRDMVVLGPPGVLATWGFDLVRQACNPSIEIRTVDRYDEIEGLGVAVGRPRILCLSHFVSTSLRKAILASSLPVVLLLEDPLDSVRHLKATLGCTVLEALRMETAATAGYAFLFTKTDVLVIERTTRVDTREIIRQILGHLHLDLSTSEYEALFRKFACGEKPFLESSLARYVAGYQAPELVERVLATEERRTVNEVLAPISHMARSSEPVSVVWPTAVFFWGDHLDHPAPLVTDLTGAARILYYGPYLHLPDGNWTVRMMVGFTEGVRGTPFSIEVFCGTRLLALATMFPAGKGVFHGSFKFAHDAPQEALEIRVRSDRGAIGGQIALGRMEFLRQPESS
jgi:hypothetical protein